MIMLQLSSIAAFWLALASLPICLWVALSDMKVMKIPNKAVLALLAVFVVVGLLTLPLPLYAWGFAQLAIVLAIGFVMNIAGLMGAGDAKFAAAMAPFIAQGDWPAFLAIFTASLVTGFIVHRALRALPWVRRMTPDWVSWQSRKYPMGLSLAASLLLYLGAAMVWGV